MIEFSWREKLILQFSERYAKVENHDFILI